MMTIRASFYLLHLLGLLVGFVILDRLDNDFLNYIDLIGADESYWISRASCGWFNQFLYCYGQTLNAYPALLKIVVNFTESVFVFSLIKTIFFMSSVNFLIGSMRKQGKSNLNLYECFLLINPYPILLHISALRDDLICALILILLGLFFKLEKRRSGRTILFFGIVAFLLGSIRFGSGVWALCFLTLFLLWKMLPRQVAILSYVVVFTASFFLVKDYLPESSFSFLHVASHVQGLLFSPLLTNVLTGTVREIGSDIALIDFYALIFPNFSFLCLLGVVVTFVLKPHCWYSKWIIRHYWVVLFGLGFLAPYIFAVADVSGPRQSLPVTLMWFYVFGVPAIRLIIGGGDSSVTREVSYARV